MKQDFCKLFVSYHKPATLVKDEVFTPIHTGRKEFDEDYKTGKISEYDYNWMMKNTLGDDSGENISELGKKLCEFTTMYWVWKNYEKIGNPEYVGFVHYRRFFLFDDIKSFPVNDNKCVVKFEKIDKEFYKAMNYTPTKLKDLLKKYDFACINSQDFGITNYEHFKKYHNMEELEYCLEIIKTEYKEIYPYALEYLNSRDAYYCNMFIMKKNIFFDYCNFLFNICFKFLKHTDYTYYSQVDARTFVLERMTGIYLYYLMQQEHLKYKTFPIGFIKSPEIENEIYPTFSERNIAIVLTSDDDYIKYTGVALTSIVENSSVKYNYDIYILTSKITENDILNLNDIIKNRLNFSIKIVNFPDYAKDINLSLIQNNTRFSGGTFYRLWIPKIFKNFNKILYLDSDLVACEDVAKLYNTDLEDNIVGATYDIELIRNLYKSNPNSEKHLNNIKNTLLMSDPYKYIQAGVLLFNVREMIKEHFFENSINFLNIHPNLPNMDQDIVNAICQNKIKYIEAAWNVEWHCVFFNENLQKTLPAKYYEMYMSARQNPKIIHYSSVWKPWKDPARPLSYYFWKYARISPFYEEILKENFTTIQNVYNNTYPSQTIERIEYFDRRILKDIVNYKKNKIRYWRYKILSNITLGKTRVKYTEKRKKMKTVLKNVRAYLRAC